LVAWIMKRIVSASSLGLWDLFLVGGFNPSEKKVSWDDYSQYMEKKMFQTTNQFLYSQRFICSSSLNPSRPTIKEDPRQNRTPMSFWILDGPGTLWEPNRAIMFMAIDMLIYPWKMVMFHVFLYVYQRVSIPFRMYIGSSYQWTLAIANASCKTSCRSWKRPLSAKAWPLLFSFLTWQYLQHPVVMP